jgi:hypothetical protein
MPAVSEKGKAAVARLYAKKPDASLDEFIAVARKADASIKEPKDRRSFNAKYVLPLKRSAAAKRRPKTAKTAKKKTAKKRGPGRPKKKVTKTAAKRGPGRPRKKTTKKVAKRGPGRPPKKRGPGRPRKEETAVKRGPGRPRKRPGIAASDFAAIKKMIISREHELMAAAGDHTKSYHLATQIDDFIEKLVKKVTG